MRATQQVQGQLSLGEEVVPEVERKVFVGAAKAGNKMVFKGANGTFSSIEEMNMW